MDYSAINFSHQTSAAGAPWEWALAPHAATRLPAAELTRWIEVGDGEVWLTGGRPDRQAADVWLQAGQRHVLPAGTEWVLEGWPQAHVRVLEAPASRRSAGRRAAGWLGAWVRPRASSLPGVALEA